MPGPHPIILIAALGVILALGAIIEGLTSRSWASRVRMSVFALILLIPAGFVVITLHPQLIDDRYRTYQRFYRDIVVGMKREEVLAKMAHHYPEGGRRKSPMILEDSPTALKFFMNPESSIHPNCEGIFLTLEHGRVIEVEYSPD